METPDLIMVVIRQNDWATSIGLKDAYFHIPVAKRSQKYMYFVINGITYHFLALLFGLSTAPLVFTHVMSEVMVYVHQKGIRLHIFLDNRLVWLLDAQQLQEDTTFILDLCAFLGLIVNVPKLSLILSGFHVLGDLHSDGILHLSPIEGQMEATINAAASLQEYGLAHCKADDEAHKHTNVYGLPSSLGRLHPRLIQLSFRNHRNREKRELWLS